MAHFSTSQKLHHQDSSLVVEVVASAMALDPLALVLHTPAHRHTIMSRPLSSRYWWWLRNISKVRWWTTMSMHCTLPVLTLQRRFVSSHHLRFSVQPLHLLLLIHWSPKILQTIKTLSTCHMLIDCKWIKLPWWQVWKTRWIHRWLSRWNLSAPRCCSCPRRH